MFKFLEKIFGDAITAKEYAYPSGTPVYIRDGFKLQQLTLGNHSCVVLSPTNVNWRLPTLKTQLQNFQAICEYPCALYLDSMTSLQRNNLLENNIPFISDSQQVYLPFWGCAFSEKLKRHTTIADKMTPCTQLIFLYLYYLQDGTKVNLSQMSAALHLSKSTCNIAIYDLVNSGLVKQQTEGRTNWLYPACTKNEYLQKGYLRLKSPVERIIYTSSNIDDMGFLISGLKALAQISMIGINRQDGATAIYKRNTSRIPMDIVIPEENFLDFGGYPIEIWSYDPVLLSADGRVDDISLLLSLENHTNERVQMGLDIIREQHKLPIQYDE